jgi:hydrogenase maturation protease
VVWSSAGLSVTESSSLVVLVVGNESRGDDALGPALLERLIPLLGPGSRIVRDFQLQLEHALELRDTELALFIDAALELDAPFNFSEIHAETARSTFSHAMKPEEVLGVFLQIEQKAPPPSFVLAIRAVDFTLGNSLSDLARSDLTRAVTFAEELLREPVLRNWRAISLDGMKHATASSSSRSDVSFVADSGRTARHTLSG